MKTSVSLRLPFAAACAALGGAGLLAPFVVLELYRARGDADAARKAEAELAKTWIGDRALLQLSKL